MEYYPYIYRMKQVSANTIKSTISDILLDVEDIKCQPKIHITKGERNGAGFSKVTTIVIRIKTEDYLHERAFVKNTTGSFYDKDRIVFDTIDRLSSYLQYEGFRKAHEEVNQTGWSVTKSYVELIYENIEVHENINRLLTTKI